MLRIVLLLLLLVDGTIGVGVGVDDGGSAVVVVVGEEAVVVLEVEVMGVMEGAAEGVKCEMEEGTVLDFLTS